MCAGFYEDPRSRLSSERARATLCREYGCCFASEEPAAAKGLRCYLPSHLPRGGCAYEGLDPQFNAATNTTGIRQTHPEVDGEVERARRRS